MFVFGYFLKIRFCCRNYGNNMPRSSIWCLSLLLLICLTASAGRAGRQLLMMKKPSNQRSPTVLEKIKQLGRGNKLTFELASKNATKRDSHMFDIVKKILPTRRVEVKEPDLSFTQKLLVGAVARAAALAFTYPLTKYKTMLQVNRDVRLIDESNMFRGLGAQLCLALPAAALQCAAIETIQPKLQALAPTSLYLPAFTLLSSAVTTTICSIFSTPETVLSDRIMAGVYPSLSSGIRSIYKNEGIRGFYQGWLPVLCNRLPTDSVTWALHAQVKRWHNQLIKSKPSPITGFVLASLASAGSAALFSPFDTAKTRIITITPQVSGAAYTGLFGAINKIAKQEGVASLYRSLPVKLLSVVPLMAVELSVYDQLKYRWLSWAEKKKRKGRLSKWFQDIVDRENKLLAAGLSDDV